MFELLEGEMRPFVDEFSGPRGPVASGYQMPNGFYNSVDSEVLYDPQTAGDVSPLLSAFEAARAERPPGLAADVFPLDVASSPALDERLLALQDVCARTQEPGAVRAALDDLSWSLLDATLEAVPRGTLVRAARLTSPHRGDPSAEHGRMLAAIEHCAAVGESALA